MNARTSAVHFGAMGIALSIAVACSKDDPGTSDEPDASSNGNGGVASGGKGAGGGPSGGSGNTQAGSGGVPSPGTGGRVGTGGATEAGTDAGSPDAGTRQVTLTFAAKVRTEIFACGEKYVAGTTNQLVEPRDFRFYVQDLELVAQGGEHVKVVLDERAPWQTADVALLDFEDGSGACVEGNAPMNATVMGTVPAGKYTGVAFTNGVPDPLNHADPLKQPAPLQVSSMTWGWLFGFKFVRAELAAVTDGDAAVVDGGAPGLGLVHLGSTGCSNTEDGGMPVFDAPPKVSCANPNRNRITLSGFDPDANVVVADVGALFAGVDLSRDNQCHSGGDSCPSEFTALGVDFATGQPKSGQTVFHVE